MYIYIFLILSVFTHQVIEVLVRAEEGLVREVVKHLNHVEEQVLESLAWKESSPLWESIKVAKNRVPSCQEVSLNTCPNHALFNDKVHRNETRIKIQDPMR